MNDQLNIEGLKKLYRSNKTARAFLDNCAQRTNNLSQYYENRDRTSHGVTLSRSSGRCRTLAVVHLSLDAKAGDLGLCGALAWSASAGLPLVSRRT
jgi:hypothetical protein